MRSFVAAVALAALAFSALSAQEDGGGESLLDDVMENAAPVTGEDALEEGFLDNFAGPEFTVISDARSGSQYVISRNETEITEYHDLKDIQFSNLAYVLTDLLKKITNDGFVYASEFTVDYGAYPYPTLVYRKPVQEGEPGKPVTAYGIIQFPQFQISVSGVKQPDAAHPYNISAANTLYSRMFAFILLLAEIEEKIGADNAALRQFFAEPEQKSE